MKKKQKKQLLYEVTVPSGVDVSLNHPVTVKGPNGELSKSFKMINIVLEKKDNNIIISSKRSAKREKKLMCSIKAHIKNMIAGVQEPFVYKMQICSVHFPMSVTLDKQNHLLKIKNFFGETKERTAKLLEGVSVEVNGDIITIISCDIEKAGQTAANIEASTRVRNKDRRIFQDGIFIISKAGEEI